jgi:cobalt-zinc-cadmium efflux system outer membrane protein
MLIRSIQLFFSVGLLTCSLTAQSQTKREVSLDEALALFYQRNLELIAAQYNVDQARADELVAGAIPNPVLGFQLAEISHKPNLGSQAQGCNHDANVSCVRPKSFPLAN